MPDEERSYQVSDAPLPPQGLPPPGIHDWILSFDLDRLVMKVRLALEGRPLEAWPQWFFKEAVGKAYITRSDRETGRISLRGACLLQGDTLYFYREEDL